MTKLSITLFSTLLLSNIAWAQAVEINSLPTAVLEVAAKYNQPQMAITPATPYSHENEKGNSLARAVLAIQGAQVNLAFNTESAVSYSRHSTESEKNNSLSRGVLAK